LATVAEVLSMREVLATMVEKNLLSPRQDEDRQRVLPLIASGIRGAIPYLWLDDLREIAIAARLPRHVIARDILPEPTSLWLYERPIAQGEPVTTRLIVGITIIGEPDYISVLALSERSEVQVLHLSPTTLKIPYGATFPDDFSEDDRGLASSILGMLAFLKSRHIGLTRKRRPRGERRRLLREGQEADAEVTFVELRRSAVRRPDRDGADQESAEIPWSHRWWVIGHPRAQWYPSLGAHRLTWIAPHIKGPADRALWPRAFRVSR